VIENRDQSLQQFDRVTVLEPSALSMPLQRDH